MLKLLNSGEWEPESIEGLSREEYISGIQRMMETERFTDEYWVREDNSRDMESPSGVGEVRP